MKFNEKDDINQESLSSQWRRLVHRALTDPEHDYVQGRCRECESNVVIDTELRPHGMADNCREHYPLSILAK